MDAALVDRAVAHVGERHATGVQIFLGEGEADTEGNLAADNAVAAVKVLLDVKEMHRAALAAGATGNRAEKLRHAGVGIGAAGQGMTMIAVGGDDGVVLVYDRNCAHGDGFLAVVQVAESLDLGLGEGLLRLLLEPANEEHLAIKREFLLRLQIGKTGRRIRFRAFNGRFGSGHMG